MHDLCARQDRERRGFPPDLRSTLPPRKNEKSRLGDREDRAKLQAAAALKTLGADPERMNCAERTFEEALAVGWFSCDQNRFA